VRRGVCAAARPAPGGLRRAGALGRAADGRGVSPGQRLRAGLFFFPRRLRITRACSRCRPRANALHSTFYTCNRDAAHHHLMLSARALALCFLPQARGARCWAASMLCYLRHFVPPARNGVALSCILLSGRQEGMALHLCTLCACRRTAGLAGAGTACTCQRALAANLSACGWRQPVCAAATLLLTYAGRLPAGSLALARSGAGRAVPERGVTWRTYLPRAFWACLACIHSLPT